MPEVEDVALGDLRFRVYTSLRPGSEQTYLLVHGIGVSHRYFARLHDALASSASVVSVDLPGFGGLPRPAESPDVPAMAAALAEVLRKTVDGPVVAVGHSMGTQWVTELALAAPDMVSHAVLLAPVIDSRHRWVLSQAAALTIDSTREMPSGNALVLADYFRCGLVWYVSQARAMLSYSIEKRVPLLSCPVLIVRGGRDPVVGRGWCRRLRAAASGAVLLEVPRAPHLVQHVAPRTLARAFHAFVTAKPRRPARVETVAAGAETTGRG